MDLYVPWEFIIKYLVGCGNYNILRIVPQNLYASTVAKSYFVDTDNMLTMHVPKVIEIYLGPG